MNDRERRSPDGNGRRTGFPKLAAAVIITAALTFGIAALLVTMIERKTEAKNRYLKFVEVNDDVTDPAVWGTNWPTQYDQYQRTVDVTNTRYGGSEAMPEQRLDRDPWLKRLYSGYAFSLDYRDRRGHAYMLSDQLQTERVKQRPQPGACLHCHSSVIPTYRRLGREAEADGAQSDRAQSGGAQADGAQADRAQSGGAQADGARADDFDWPAVFRGFELVSAMPYAEAYAELTETSAPHPVSCVDCHDPQSMELRATRPGFVRGIQALAASDAPVPHLPSIERWRDGSRAQPYDPNVDASRGEMRSFVCGQCHVEYYFRGDKKTVTYPWYEGLRIEQIESYYDDSANFDNSQAFVDWKHGETGAGMLKAQHPEFEMWSQGVHARAGVACADCHMPYMRQGALKVSDHWVRSPLLMVNRSCQTCHSVAEDELVARAQTIQDRTHTLLGQASRALTDMLDAIQSAKAAGATDAELAPAYALQRKAQWRIDFISSENSMGFHADQEAARVLAESIDYSRQAQVAALSIRTPAAPATTHEGEPVHGVTPTENAPAGRYRQLEAGSDRPPATSTGN
jgi:nitrite reductase (cytochrome c-552)